jgi:AcrR family transcriptional regulator
MRSIAADAGVDPALIYHYFATKDALLGAVLTLPFDPAVLLAGLELEPERAGTQVVRRVLGVWDADPQARQTIVGLLRVGLSHEHAADVLRDVLGDTILAAVQRVVAPDHAALRAALVGSQIGGLILARYVLQLPAVADASAEDLVAAIGPTVQRYLTGPLR